MTDFIVAAGWEDNKKIGICHVERVRGTERISFEYDEEWLLGHPDLLLDVDLTQSKGVQFVTDKKCFGFLSDVAPDRWGRKLLERREAELAQEENRLPKKLMESDYILGVSDTTRQGGIRILSATGSVCREPDKDEIPPLSDIRELEHASIQLEKNEGNVRKWISQLVDPGSSLGGARPKANVIDTDGSLWIAKFPSKNDEINVGAWEMVCHDLAEECGINVPKAKVMRLSDYGDTFMVQRFDRQLSGKELKRIHFASAMTMLGETDNSEHTSGYLDLVDVIEKTGNDASDLAELWKRMVFNICVGNADDHLRNHGFLLRNGSWSLSPAYDVNPVPDQNFLSLTIDGNDSRKSITRAIGVSEFFRISEEEAENMAREIAGIVSACRGKLIKKYGIKKQEAERMRPAFSEADSFAS